MIAGWDIGWSKRKKTNGVAFYQKDGALRKCKSDKTGALQTIIEAGDFAVIALDGPIIAAGSPQKMKRNVETLFVRGPFHNRCKPGMSHHGYGLNLRCETSQAADELVKHSHVGSMEFPQIRNGTALIEAFPNAFLGVCLSDAVYAAILPVKRGKKFDVLYEQFCRCGCIKKFDALGKQEQTEWQKMLEDEYDHELRAGLICLLTALLVQRGFYTALGDESGGWFFLPSCEAWQGWAWQGVGAGQQRLAKEGQEITIITRP